MSEITKNHNISRFGAGAAKAVMHFNPITSFVQTIYDEYASYQWQKRREKWEEIFEEKLQNIKDKIDLNQINQIPNFAQILSHAVQGAMVDLEEDKVSLYANAVINSLKNESIDDTKKHIFLNMLRDFTKLHLAILQDVASYEAMNSNKTASGFADVDRTLFDKMQKKYDNMLLRCILVEMHDANLIDCDSIDDCNSGVTYYPKSLTSLGYEFLNFITDNY